MMCPSDMRMPSIFVAILLSTHGLFDLKKCPDVPDSAASRLSTCLCVIVFVVPVYNSHTALLPQDTLPIEAQHAHIFPDLKNKALLSIGMFCA